mmetsp:Transcript_78588/g.163293  ORF Transcript_78588/g.163293 Transcript_78588/m.163293 type:complete len:431 (-) Transcript_78588:31-1323(-)
MADEAYVKLGDIGAEVKNEKESLWISRIGGSPCWPQELSRRPARPSPETSDAPSLACQLCEAPLMFIGQFSAGYDTAPRRLLHLFGCLSGACPANGPGAWRAFRSVAANVVEAAPQAEATSASEAPAAPAAVSAAVEDDWGVPAGANGSDWGAAEADNDEDWGVAAPMDTTTQDLELDSLLQATSGSAAASSSAAATSSSKKAAKVPQAPTAEEDAWRGVAEVSAIDCWPCLHLDIYNEPEPETEMGEHEKELLDRYLKSGLADEDGGTSSDALTSALPKDILDDLKSEEAKLRAEGKDDEEDDFGEDSDDDMDGDCAASSQWLQRFQRRLERSPAQVVRYSWGGSPLWLAPPPKELASGSWPPCCTRCGAARIFEMQVLPTLAARLQKVLPEGAPGLASEWGTIAIYTCSKDCTSEEVSEEFVVVQPAP